MRTAPAPGLGWIQGNRIERLRDLLVEWVGAHPLDVFDDETLLVQSQGMAQWLRFGLAGEHGVAAGLRFELPARFVWSAYRAVLGEARVHAFSPFDRDELVWRLHRLLPTLCDEPVFAPLAPFFERAATEAGAMPTRPDAAVLDELALRLADLFDQYQVYRADWLNDWAAGRHVLRQADGTVVPLPEAARWQAALWQRLSDALVAADDPRRHAHRAALHQDFMDALGKAVARPAGLPSRVIVFGLSSQPRQMVEALVALSRVVQVLVFVLNPSDLYWADLSSGAGGARRVSRMRRWRDAGAVLAAQHALETAEGEHPLLAAWGRQGADFLRLLTELEADAGQTSASHPFAALGNRIDQFESPDKSTLLGQIQDDILALRAPAASRQQCRAVDVGNDRSLRFQVAHSAMREVEILHDALLDAFEADDTLRARDVVVMMPDAATYRPAIEAVFGQYERSDARAIPYSLADVADPQAQMLLDTLAALLTLPTASFAASELLALLDCPALARRFGLDGEAAGQARALVRLANIRWGASAAHKRARAGADVLADDAGDNTWQFGLDRLVLGYAGATHWGSVRAAALDWGDAAVMGGVWRLFERLDHYRVALAHDRTPLQWQRLLATLLTDCFLTDEGSEAVLLSRATERLDALLAAADRAGMDAPLPLAVVAGHWLSALAPLAQRQRFFGGGVVFATLMPMRALPFRMVCLLGMNEHDYPRQQRPPSFDLMARHPRAGDRSRREDDRYLLLEALLSARQRLYVSWVGRSARDNTPRPPSVLVEQLRDLIRTGWRLAGTEARPDADGDALLAALTTEHPLQPFSPRYFRADSPLATFAREWCVARGGASAAAVNAPLDPPSGTHVLELDALIRALTKPARAFYAQRLGVRWDDEPVDDDCEPLALDGLSRWSMTDALIQAQLVALSRGEPAAPALDATLDALAKEGRLPQGVSRTLARAALREPMAAVGTMLDAVLREWPLAVPPHSQTRAFAPHGGLALTVAAQWAGLRTMPANGPTPSPVLQLRLDASALFTETKTPKPRLAKLYGHWAWHVALNAMRGASETRVMGRDVCVRFPPLGKADADALLEEMLQRWVQAMTRPLPFLPELAEARVRDEADPARLRTLYEGGGYADAVDGLRDRDRTLAWTWPDFDALAADPDFALNEDGGLVAMCDHLVAGVVATDES